MWSIIEKKLVERQSQKVENSDGEATHRKTEELQIEIS